MIKQKTVLCISVAKRLEVDGQDVDEKVLWSVNVEFVNPQQLCETVQKIAEEAEKFKFQFNVEPGKETHE